MAAEMGHANVVRIILDDGRANARKVNKIGWTAWTAAANKGRGNAPQSGPVESLHFGDQRPRQG